MPPRGAQHFCRETRWNKGDSFFRESNQIIERFLGMCVCISPEVYHRPSGGMDRVLPPQESAFFDTFFHASAERKYEKAEFRRNSTAINRREA